MTDKLPKGPVKLPKRKSERIMHRREWLQRQVMRYEIERQGLIAEILASVSAGFAVEDIADMADLTEKQVRKFIHEGRNNAVTADERGN